MEDLRKLISRKRVDPYISYRARVESERKEKGLRKNDITIEEVNWKLAEIDERYGMISERTEVLYPCIQEHYNNARSISGVISKNGKVTKKQWSKLIEISFCFLEVEHPRGNHYCKR